MTVLRFLSQSTSRAHWGVSCQFSLFIESCHYFPSGLVVWCQYSVLSFLLVDCALQFLLVVCRLTVLWLMLETLLQLCLLVSNWRVDWCIRLDRAWSRKWPRWHGHNSQVQCSVKYLHTHWDEVLVWYTSSVILGTVIVIYTLTLDVWFIPQHQFCLPEVPLGTHICCLALIEWVGLLIHLKFDNRLRIFCPQCL